ncbi:MAG: hypothetical protein KatS3mg031_1169 [Chitinophagales bacterium]|nr:MAG: hypothetical protein KatS3mg031_1169 [Chitinophagales bacterium]
MNRAAAKKRIFIGLKEVAGYYYYISQGLRELGYPVTLLYLSQHQFRYGSGYSNRLLSLLYKLERCSLQNTRGRGAGLLRNLAGIVARMYRDFVVRPVIFVWALLHHDVFIFGFASTFFFYVDTFILRLAGKQIIYVFNGSDARPPYIDGSAHKRALRLRKPLQMLFLLLQTMRIKTRVFLIEHLAHRVIIWPGGAQFLTRRAISGITIGVPLCIKPITGHPPPPAGDKITILHAPSNPVEKGTDRIREVISKLKQRYSIAFVEIRNMPNEQVLQEITKCDFIIDQLYSDTPMAGFATEAAFFGKPAVVGGYYARHLRLIHAEEDIAPSLFVHPDELESAIEKMVTDAAFRNELGQRAQHFVRTRWHYTEVARKYAVIIEGEAIPDSWWFDPRRIQYVHGWGCPETAIGIMVSRMVKNFGAWSLFLNDKPQQKAALLQLAGLQEKN